MLSILPLLPDTEKLAAVLQLPGHFREGEKMPVFFIGHGNPANAFRDNPFTRSLQAMGNALQPRPSTILVVSAHWQTLGETLISTKNTFTTPEYKVSGSPEYARAILQEIPALKEEEYRELDHGAWAILRHIAPARDIPVLELSIDMGQPASYHWKLAQQLKSLRSKGVLIIGSGNIVHNLELSALKMATLSSKPFHWALEFDQWVKGRIDERDFSSLFFYYKLGKIADLAVPTTDHFIPMLYSLALADANEPISYTYEEVFSGISMRCLRIG
jgi:4,5-DOPA dioxygenase extradiol